MMNSEEKLKLAVMLRFADYSDGVSQVAFITCKLQAIASELMEVVIGLLASEQGNCVTEDDVRSFLKDIVRCSEYSEQQRASLEITLDLLFAQASTQPGREDHFARCRGPRLDPGGGPLPPDDHDLNDPW